MGESNGGGTGAPLGGMTSGSGDGKHGAGVLLTCTGDDDGGAHGEGVILGNGRDGGARDEGGTRSGERGNDNGGASDDMGTVTGGTGHDLC